MQIVASRRRRLCALFIAMLGTAGLAGTSEASWVRGTGRIAGGATVDPLFNAPPPQPLIPTISTGTFADGQKSFTSVADLGNGALRARATIAAGTASVSANPVMGDTVTFVNNGTRPSVGFSFAVDGRVTTGANPVPVTTNFGSAGTFQTTFAQFAVHIFPANSVGPIGTPNSWQSRLNTALFTQTKDVAGFPTSGSLPANANTLYTDTISGSLPLALGTNSFDIVLVLNATANISSGTVSSLDMNFLNTAAFSVTPGVPFTSNSRVFLTGINVVPEPTTLALFAAAFPLIARRTRRA